MLLEASDYTVNRRFGRSGLGVHAIRVGAINGERRDDIAGHIGRDHPHHINLGAEQHSEVARSGDDAVGAGAAVEWEHNPLGREGLTGFRIVLGECEHRAVRVPNHRVGDRPEPAWGEPAGTMRSHHD